jgi:NADH-quinone oxidoreductase subunit H
LIAFSIVGVDWHEIWPLIIKLGVALGVIPALGIVFGYLFLYKILSHMQSRLGPMEAGGGPRFHGWAQLIADAVKFIQKEDIVPESADRHVFAMAPGVVLMSTFLLFVVIPASSALVIVNLDVGIFFALAVGSISTVGVLMAGWSSANKYSLMGGLRAAGQIIAYELPLVLAVVGVVMQAGTLSLNGIVESQAHFHVANSTIVVPYVVPQFIGFMAFLISSQAEVAQAPFDMPIAESELVFGYQTEYSGMRFLMFYLGEISTTIALSAIASTLFLGGYWFPFVGANALKFVGPLVLLGKTFLVAFILFWVRFSYPRLREDQLQKLAWKFLIPLTLVNIMATGVAKVVFS